MIKEVLDLLMEYRGMSTVFGGDLEADVRKLLASKEGIPFFSGSEEERLRTVMKTLFEMHLLTALDGDAEGEVFVHCDRVVELGELIAKNGEQLQTLMSRLAAR